MIKLIFYLRSYLVNLKTLFSNLNYHLYLQIQSCMYLNEDDLFLYWMNGLRYHSILNNLF